MMRVLQLANQTFFAFCLWIGFAAAADLPLPVAEMDRTEPVSFRKEIVPILKQNCLACHHEKEAEGGLVLETIESVRKGGDSGHGVVASNVEASLLFTRSSGMEEPLMPPEDNEVGAKPLTPHELALLKLWIEQGALDDSGSARESIDWQPIPKSIRTSYAMDVSPDGQRAAVSQGNRIMIIDLQSHAIVQELNDPSLSGSVADVDLIQSIAFSPDAQRIATGGFRTVRIWKRSHADPSSVDTPLASASGIVTVKSDDTATAFINAIGDIEIWDLAANQKTRTISGHADPITGLAWPGTQDLLYACDQAGRITAWQPSTGKKLSQFDSNTALGGLVASPDALHVAAIDGERKAQLFRVSPDGKSMERIAESVGDVTDVNSIALTQKPKPMVILASEAGGIMWFGVADVKLVRKVDHGAIVDALAVTTDQTRLVTGGRDGNTRIWNLADGKALATMQGDAQSRLQVAAANRDAARQKAAVERLNKKTDELKKLLTKETEALTKVTEEHKKATEALAAEDKKLAAAVEVAGKTESLLAKAASDAASAAKMNETAKESLTKATAISKKLATEVATKTTTLQSAKEEAARIQQQVAALTKKMTDAAARASQIEAQIAEKNSAIKKAKQDAATAQKQIDDAAKLAAEAKAATEKATKDLEAQKKAVTAAEAAKKKSELEVTKRRQALETSTNAKKRAADAIPAHEATIQSETRRLKTLDDRLATIQGWSSQSGNELVSAAVSRDDKSIATTHRNGSVRVYRISDGAAVSQFASDQRQPNSQVGFLGDSIYTFGLGQTATVWSMGTRWNLERTIGAVEDASIFSDRVTAIDFRGDGMSIAVGSGPPSRSGEVKIYDVENGRLLRDFGPVHSDTVLGVQFSPDGTQLASSAADKTIRILDLAGGSVVRSLEGHTHHVLSLAWQDDGQTIASASADQSVKVWNAETGEQRRTISGFSKEITAVAFVQTSNQIVTACADGQVRLSDTSNGKSLRTFNAGGDFLFALSVTPDGTKLLASGQSGVVRIWTLADGKLVHELK